MLERSVFNFVGAHLILRRALLSTKSVQDPLDKVGGGRLIYSWGNPIPQDSWRNPFGIRCTQTRTKLRGSLKALITKVVKETLLLAWWIAQGMVISLKMKNNLFMKWVITDLSHSWFKVLCKQTINLKDVKEQRVDGSSNSRILDFVRCTLVAGKPVLG